MSIFYFISNDLKYETLDKMIKKSLVQVGIHGKYDLHDCIREFFYNRLTPKIRKEYHKKIALFYLEEKDELSYIEAEYHYCKAEEYKNAMSLIIKNGNKPIKKGYLEEFMPILNEFDEKKVTPQHWAKILMFKGDINYQKSNWDEALIYYHSTLKISKKLRDNMKIAESYLKIGHVEEAQSKWDSAAENFNKVLKISKKINDLNGIIEGNLGLGKIYFRKGEFNKAIFCLNKALKENKKINDSYRESKIFMELGNINGEKGEYDKAIEFYNKSLKIFKELKNKFEIVRAYNNISTTYTYKWEWDKAIEYSKKQIILAEEIGDIRGLAHGFNALAYDYLQIGNLKEATQYWEKATQLINKFGEKILLAVTLEIHACILWKKKEWNKALEQFNESIDTFKEIGYFGFGFGNACDHSGLMQKEKGDFKAAKQKLRKALKTFKKLGNNQMIKKVESELTVL